MISNTSIEKSLIDINVLSNKLCPLSIQGKLAYATQENFIGRIIDGYSADASDVFLLTREVAYALCKVQNDLLQKKLSLFIFDAYRPHRAVRDFSQWFQQPPANDYELIRKEIHYPHLQKTDLPRLGYAAGNVSNHNFGNTVDLSIISLEDSKLLDMGACFDFFDVISHHTATPEQISQTAYENRQLLVKVMQQHGFIPYEKEFWHFSYFKREVDEPMDLPFTASYKGLNVI